MSRDKERNQATLFNAWGVGKDKRLIEGADREPSCQSADAKADLQDCAVIDEEEGDPYGFGDFDDILGVATEEELFQDCQIIGETCNPSVSNTGTKQMKQSTIPFHVGPSAAAHSILNRSVIEESIPGFDTEAGEMWIYPTNYPVRDYQFNITKKALFVNTLVCLPTGLGKTFIAAVLMYNYYRWYPSGKIVFLAPTKPLVTQQIEACHKIMGIPQHDVAEMTGTMSC